MILDKNGNPMPKLMAQPKSGYSKKNPSEIIANIAQTFKDRSRKDIGKWRTAIQLAEHPDNPTRQPLMDMINDLMTDGHLKSQIKLRKSVVLNKMFNILDQNGEIEPDLTKFINAKWFYDLLELYVDTDLYGHSLVEIREFVNSKPKIALVPRRNVQPTKGRVIPDLSKPKEFIDYTAPALENWIIEMGDRHDLGIINDIIPNLIWKRNIMQSWAEFCERFGIPMVTATTLRATDDSIALIEKMLQQLGEAAYGVFPEGTTIDFKEANRTDAYQTFDKLIERCDKEISKAIVGGTMVSDDGSSRSQSEVHERNLEKRLGTADRREITFFLNESFFPVLTKHGLAFTEDTLFAFDTTQEIDIQTHWGIVKDIIGTGKYKVDSIWISKTFNVPLEEITQEIETVAKKKTNFSMSRYQNIHQCSMHSIESNSGMDNSILLKLQEKIIAALYADENFDQLQAELTINEAQLLFNGLRSGYGSMSNIAWDAPDHLMLALMEQNLFSFATGKTEARLAAINKYLINPETNKLREYNDFKSLATKDLQSYNENWLRTEWNLSVATGQNSAAYLRAMAEINDFPYVQYFTAGDSNVRAQHALLNGRIFNLRDVEARQIWPPNDHGCRCEMLQYAFKPSMDGVTSGKEAKALLGEKFAKSEFAVNRAEVKKVFLENQMYKKIKGIPDKLSSLNFEDWKLTPYSEMANLPIVPIDKTITKENVKELFVRVAKEKALMAFSDYLQRKVFLKESVFNNHTKGKYTSDDELRHQLFPEAMKIMSDPDEVWMLEDGREIQLTYIKFYSDRVLVTVANLKKNNGYEIKTWYSMKFDEKLTRKGLLLRSKP